MMVAVLLICINQNIILTHAFQSLKIDELLHCCRGHSNTKKWYVYTYTVSDSY